MSSSPYATVMRKAPNILFAMAVILFVTSLLGGMFDLTVPGQYDESAVFREKTGKLFQWVADAMYNAVLPLFGAAFIHRMDSMLESRK